ncbi:hypothetical protein MVEN_01349800 [Mycena venus]|uniref:Uncharacterized protein n=1 Tax=Mycena venus TaxID=2733690 RepID=A0A8H6Y1F0_9AGAR|nr:hypothetical protein MVEN_01349800 [Mycena venus]
MSSCFWDEKTEETFHYSSFPWIQGRLLRGAIKYLAALDKRPVDKQALLDAGVPIPHSSMGDSAAIQEFGPVMTEALALLNSWVREPTVVKDFVSKMFGGKGAWGTPSVLESKYPLSDILNTPFFIEKVAEEKSVCPPCLAKLGLGGLFLCMEISEDRLEVLPGGAKEIVDALDRLESYTDWEGWEDVDSDDDEDEAEPGETVKETKTKGSPGQQMRAVFAACSANPESSIVG